MATETPTLVEDLLADAQAKQCIETKERINEVRIALTHALNGIDQSFNFQVEAGPPPDAAVEEGEEGARKTPRSLRYARRGRP